MPAFTGIACDSLEVYVSQGARRVHVRAILIAATAPRRMAQPEREVSLEDRKMADTVVPEKSAGTRSAERRKKHARSRISNGRDLLPDIDGRSVVARRYRDIASAILSD